MSDSPCGVLAERTDFYDFFLRRAARWFFAAFMLSTRFGYFRPGLFAAALALVLLFGVNLVRLRFPGAGLFQGAFVFFFAGMRLIRFGILKLKAPLD